MRLYKICRMRFLIAGILVLVSTLGFAQSSVLRFTDYGVTRPLINPACMGLEEGVNGLLLYRSLLLYYSLLLYRHLWPTSLISPGWCIYLTNLHTITSM